MGITHDNDRYDGGFWGPTSFTVKGGVFTHFLALIFQGQKLLLLKGAGTFHSAGQSKEGYVGFGTSEHPIFMKLLQVHLGH